MRFAKQWLQGDIWIDRRSTKVQHNDASLLWIHNINSPKRVFAFSLVNRAIYKVGNSLVLAVMTASNCATKALNRDQCSHVSRVYMINLNWIASTQIMNILLAECLFFVIFIFLLIVELTSNRIKINCLNWFSILQENNLQDCGKDYNFISMNSLTYYSTNATVLETFLHSWIHSN